MINLITGLVFSCIIALAGYLKHSLSLSGALSAIALGTLIYFLGGFFFAAVMVGFFISSSLLTKYKQSLKEESEKFHDKGGRRDFTQVAANGFLGLVYALIFYITKEHAFIIGYAAAFASSNSDTWASELGVLSKTPPVSILTFKPVKRGMSGGVSLPGTIASMVGAGFIAVLASAGYAYYYGLSTNIIFIYLIIAAAGFGGNLIDSLLGATLQAKYICKICGEMTERKIHHDTPCELVSGIAVLDNNAVNFLSSLIASLGAVVVYEIIF